MLPQTNMRETYTTEPTDTKRKNPRLFSILFAGGLSMVLELSPSTHLQDSSRPM